MASGGTRVFRDSFTATGAAKNITSPGFKPVKVVIRTSGGAKMEWQDTMPDASAFKTVTAGTHTYVTVNGITPLDNGFTLGADAQANVDGATVHFEAYES